MDGFKSEDDLPKFELVWLHKIMNLDGLAIYWLRRWKKKKLGFRNDIGMADLEVFHHSAVSQITNMIPMGQWKKILLNFHFFFLFFPALSYTFPFIQPSLSLMLFSSVIPFLTHFLPLSHSFLFHLLFNLPYLYPFLNFFIP